MIHSRSRLLTRARGRPSLAASSLSGLRAIRGSHEAPRRVGGIQRYGLRAGASPVGDTELGVNANAVPAFLTELAPDADAFRGLKSRRGQPRSTLSQSGPRPVPQHRRCSRVPECEPPGASRSAYAPGCRRPKVRRPLSVAALWGRKWAGAEPGRAGRQGGRVTPPQAVAVVPIVRAP